MSRNVITVTNNASINETIEKMFIHNIGGIPIVTSDNRVVGIVTERDFVRLLADKFTGRKVEELMTTKVVTAPPGMTILDAARVMIRNGFRRLPVVQDGFLIGILTATDILAFLGRNRVFEKLSTTRVEEALETRIEEIMTKTVRTVGAKSDLGASAKLMLDRGLGALPVVEDKSLLGLITERDLLFSTIPKEAIK